MFKDLRAGTKFLILCGVSLALTSVATYALLAEKQIAISFAHSELVGSKYLAMLRPIYRTVLGTQSEANSDSRQIASRLMPLRCCRVPTRKPELLQIENIVQSLAAALHDLDSGNARCGVY